MATAPQIALRDGSGFTTSLVFTTNEESIVITGTVSVDTVSIQVSINGGDFVSDPNLVSYVLQTFTVPNLTVYPTGLQLDYGVNTILLRTIDIVGGVSATSSVLVTRLDTANVPGSQIPTGIRVRRYRNYIEVLAGKPVPLTNVIQDDNGEFVSVTSDQADFRGFNFYASVDPAGASGYYKLNETPITSPSEFVQSDINTISDTALWDVSDAANIRVRVTEEDEFGNELTIRLDSYHNNRTLSGSLEFTSGLRNYEMHEFLVFTHNRSGGAGLINTDQFLSVPDSDPLYYVVTGIYWDPATGMEIETPYSQEVLGSPLVIDTTIKDLPERSAADITVSYMRAIQRVDNDIAIIPGSVTRDVDIDPFASEASRLWFLLDFVHRSQSFLTLLTIDNVSGSGISDPVATSAYKQGLKAALGLTNDSAVQSLVDQQFDKLAANVNKYRLTGRSSVGSLVLYTTTRPTQDIQIPANSIAMSTADASTGVTQQRYLIGGSYVMYAANAESYYNFDNRRYEIRVAIIAESAGSAGDVPPNSIKTIIGVNGLQAVNDAATVFGDDRETNADLAARAILGFASVDTGTEGGYAATAAAKLGVIRTQIIKSGDALMMRDYDDVRAKHIGGKVDVWIQGVQERQVSEKFAFTFSVATNVQCEIIDLSTLTFRVLDSRVTLNTPIIEIVSVRNATLGQDYNTAGATILDFDRFKLDPLLSQPATVVDDVILATYRFQADNKLYMTVQPVIRVTSVVGEVSGALTAGTHYQLYKTDDPLLEGESTIAKNYVSITPVGGVPSGDSITVNNELHVLIGFEYEPLSSVGINTATIRVFSEDRSIEYSGPSAIAPDFDVIEGTATTPAKIVRTQSSIILSGQEVSVDYDHDENFTVTYVVNELLQQLQDILNVQRHVTADVLAKQAIQNGLNIDTTVQLDRGATKDTTDPIVRNNVSLDLDQKRIGQGVAQSNVTAAINDSDGVQYNVQPMARMAYADGSVKLRESVLSSYTVLSTLSLLGNTAYILNNALQYPTTDGGGLSTEHKGVFQDDVSLPLVADIATVSIVGHRSYIIGSAGAVILGYSDDATLASEGYLPNEYETERLRRTANHVVISLPNGGSPQDVPTLHEYAVSYVVRGDVGPHDISVAAVEVTVLNNLTITYRQYTEG